MGLRLFYVALDLEREGFKLFNDLSKEFFLQMLEMERGHRELLESSIAYLEAPKNFYAEQERPFDAR